MGNNTDKRLWGVLGKQKTFYSPQKQVEGKTKTPLNSNAFDSWDAKRSRFKRVDGYENQVPNHIQQHGVVPETSSPVITPTPSSTPQPTPSITATQTPTLTPDFCREYTIQGGFGATTFNWTNCDGSPGTITLPCCAPTVICAINGSVSQSGSPGTITPGGACSITPTPTSTPTYTPTPSITPTSTEITTHEIWNTNNRKWENDNQLWNA